MKNTDICPVELAGTLDNRLRKIFQNPNKLLGQYLNDGMQVLDMGCGPGFFTIEIAKMIGERGKVIAADLQEGMLDIIRKKITGTKLEDRIVLHKCNKDNIGLDQKVDFINTVYMIHEIQDKTGFFKEACGLLKPGGKMYILEPKFHVSKEVLANYSVELEKNGMKIVHEKKTFFELTLVAQKN